MTYPFIQARQHGGEGNLPPSRIVIHATVSPCLPGGARGIASYFADVTRPASAHYVVDPGEIIQCLRETTVGYHAPPNTHSIGIELCDPQAGSGSRWGEPDHEAMLDLAAGLVREVATRYGIPLVKLSSADLLAGRRGICGHVDVTNAWHQTTHTDPGPDFPWAHFMALVQGDDDVTPEDIDKIADTVVERLLIKTGTEAFGSKGPEGLLTGLGRLYRTAVAALVEGRANAATAATERAALGRRIDAVTAALPEQVKAAITDATVDVQVNVNGKAK